MRGARVDQHLHRERRAESVGDHSIDEAAARKLSGFYLGDEATQSLFVHLKTPRNIRLLSAPRGSRFDPKENRLTRSGQRSGEGVQVLPTSQWLPSLHMVFPPAVAGKRENREMGVRYCVRIGRPPVCT